MPLTNYAREQVLRGFLANLNYPDYVVALEFEFNYDWTGDQIIFIWIILTDQMAKSDHFFETSLDFQDQIRQTLGSEFDEYVHIRFRSKSEQRKIKSKVTA